MAKEIVTNTDVGPRGFYSGGALIMLEPGESTADAVEIDKGAGDYFKLGGAAGDDAAKAKSTAKSGDKTDKGSDKKS